MHDAAVDVEVAAGKTTDAGTLTTQRFTVLRGKLVRPKGEPVEGAKVKRAGYARHTLTDKDGTFILQHTISGEQVLIYASSPEHSLGALAQVMVPKGETAPVLITLSDLGEVKGKVEDDEGRPVKEVQVSAALMSVAHPLTRSFHRVESATTDDEGVFRLKLPPGKWRMEAVESDGVVPVPPEGEEEVLVAPGKPVDHLNLKVKRTVKIKGVLVGPEGKPVTNAAVKMDFRPRPYSSGEKGLERGGTFTVEGVVPDEALTVLAFTLDRTLGALVEVRVKKGQTEPVSVRLAACAKLTGKIADEQGQPLTSAYVRASRTIRGRGRHIRPYHVLTTQTDPQGRFALHLPPAIEYELIADTGTWGYIPERILNLTAEGERDIGTLALKKADGFVAGKVADVDAKPVQGARVRAFTEAQPWLANTFVTTNAQGRYRVEGLAPGKVNLIVEHKSVSTTKQDVQTGSENMDIVLAPRRDDVK